MKQSLNYALNKPEQSDVVNIEDLNANFDTMDSELKKVSDKVNLIQTAGGTGTAITLNNINTVSGYTVTFLVAANNNGAATTINGKPLYKPGGAQAPTLTAGKAVTVWYDTGSGGRFYAKTSIEGDTVASATVQGLVRGGGDVKVNQSTGDMTVPDMVKKDGSVPMDDLTVGSRKSGSTIGANSFAQGTNADASGTNSHAEGAATTASGNYSHSEGNATKASGESSHAEGYNSYAFNMGGHAEGISTLEDVGTTYKVTAFNNTNKTLTLETVTGLSVGNNINIFVFSEQSLNQVPITAINGLTITLSTIETITSKWKYVIKQLATGYSSHAEGTLSLATGESAHAEGEATEALGGQGSHAEGHYTKALGAASHAEGISTTASGSASHVEGYMSHTFSPNTHAEGTSSLADVGAAYKITAFNNTSKTITLDSVSGLTVGNKLDIFVSLARNLYQIPITAINGLVVTLNTAETLSAGWTYAIKQDASGYPAHAEGVASLATGQNSHAEGDSTRALGIQGSHAEGCSTIAKGAASHAEGYNCNAAGDYSHAEGSGCGCMGLASHAGGQGSFSDGSRSFAHGLGLSAQGNEQAAFGRYNAPNASDLFQVGMGTSIADRKNAMRVTSDGDIINGYGDSLHSLSNLPYVSGNLVTIISNHVAAGRWAGRILFTPPSTNLPPDVTGLGIDFKTFYGTAAIYLDGYYFSAGVFKRYSGVINDGAVTWIQL
jgi:hypothetical protein